MVNQRFCVVLAIVVALAAQTYSRCITMNDLSRILGIRIERVDRMPNGRPVVHLPDEWGRGDGRLRSMPLDGNMDEFIRLPPRASGIRSMLDMSMLPVRLLSNHRNVRMRSLPVDDAMDKIEMANAVNSDHPRRLRTLRQELRMLPAMLESLTPITRMRSMPIDDTNEDTMDDDTMDSAELRANFEEVKRVGQFNGEMRSANPVDDMMVSRLPPNYGTMDNYGPKTPMF